MAARRNKLVCICNGVTETEIVNILKKGAVKLDDVRKFTLASTSCGRCKPEVEALVERYLKNKKRPLQQKLEF
jgi:nitrite reductase (NADH) large subunit